jgi:hypothetical protein
MARHGRPWHISPPPPCTCSAPRLSQVLASRLGGVVGWGRGVAAGGAGCPHVADLVTSGMLVSRSPLGPGRVHRVVLTKRLESARPLWPEPSRPVNPPGHGRPRRPTPRVVDPGQWPSPDWPGWPFRVTGQKNRGSPVNGHPSPPPPPPTAKTH